MRLRLLLFVLTVLALPAEAFEPAISGVRAPNQSWQEALKTAFEAKGLSIKPDGALGAAAISSPRIGGIPEWRHGLEALSNLYVAARDIRIHPNPNSDNFRRRAAWLYPADGCYSKAAHVSYIAAKKGYVKPGKIYAFGSLRYNSRYADNGATVYWSYHVAAAYRIGPTIYVLDPSVTSKGLLTREEWLELISADPSSVQVSLCDSHSYSPYSTCVGGDGNGAYLGHMQQFLELEWSGLIKLGFSPKALLGP
jgi:hypothetical protein